MGIRLLIAAAVLMGAFATPGAASAQEVAFAAPGTTNVRTGPGTRYRIIARVRGGTPMEVHGCLANGTWCSVSAGRVAGWMAGSRLQFVHAGRRVVLRDYYREFRAPIIEYRIRRERPPCDRRTGRYCGYLPGEPLPPPTPMAPQRPGAPLPPPTPMDGTTGQTVILPSPQ